MRNTSLECVHQLAKIDERVLFLGSDLGPGVLNEMKTSMPDRFFMEGVAEQHIVGMAAGLAMEGFIPFVNTIATFMTRRCFEQVALDLCLHDLPVRLIGNGGGVVYAPLGPTHLATEDLAIFRALPNMTIVAPCDADEMKRLMSKTLDWPHPIYIRLGKGGDAIVSREDLGFEIGKGYLLQPPGQGLFITTGVMAQRAFEATKQLASEGIACGVLHMPTVKPLDHEILCDLIPAVQGVVTIEEHTRIGGLGSAVLEFCSDEIPQHTPKIRRVGLPDRFADQYGNQNSLLDHMGISIETICKNMRSCLKGNPCS